MTRAERQIAWAKFAQLKATNPNRNLNDCVNSGELTLAEAMYLGHQLWPPRKNPYYTGM